MRGVVSLFGPDGAGKTTLANMLARELSSSGFKISRVWIKNNHTLAYLLASLVDRLSPGSMLRSPSGALMTHRLAYSSIGRRIWPWIELLSIIPHLVLKVFFKRALGEIIIADRYLADTIVHTSIATLRYTLDSYPARLLLRLLKDSKLIYIDVSPEESRARRAKSADPAIYLEIQRALYRRIASITRSTVINSTNLEIAQVYTTLRRLVLE